MKKETVVVENISKKYTMYARPSNSLRRVFRQPRGEEFYALRNVSFTAYQGDCIGIIGENGSGKSTLVNIISGIVMPTSGSVKCNGEVSILAIKTGLSNQLTGIENIMMKGLLLGKTKAEIEEMTPSIIEFADIGAHIYQPVKTYSSGMKARLGFAISVNTDPDILIIDEALSVGDRLFKDRCEKKMKGFIDNQKTVFFVSHNLTQVRDFCHKVLWIDQGLLVRNGATCEVLDLYERDKDC